MSRAATFDFDVLLHGFMLLIYLYVHCFLSNYVFTSSSNVVCLLPIVYETLCVHGLSLIS